MLLPPQLQGPRPALKASGFHHVPKGFYHFIVRSSGGDPLYLGSYAGKVSLVVNVASKCGYTDVNYKQLQQLQAKYESKGFTVLAFPSNTFNQEYPTNDEVVRFARNEKGATFPIFSKIEVNGPLADPAFGFLKQAANVTQVAWNFEKFLVGQDGAVLRHYSTRVNPAEIEQDIVQALAHQPLAPR
eukprot:NODE_1004_length_1051_cov_14.578842_g830_i0.p1 GENE.NODE_1004_length_1051_cov_14.578842_g830_i0~~NODE_1004_length_1051_cov_14.578842_g830_i0.p1  ORF type:complete len:186 (+),score=14.17 NODE_1004_length_1051_cov_14.578842_g830_i0:268-825(+)